MSTTHMEDDNGGVSIAFPLAPVFISKLISFRRRWRQRRWRRWRQRWRRRDQLVPCQLSRLLGQRTILWLTARHNCLQILKLFNMLSHNGRNTNCRWQKWLNLHIISYAHVNVPNAAYVHLCRLTHVLRWQSSNRLVFNNSFALCNARYRSLVRTKALWEKQRKCTPAPERRRRPARLSRLTTFTISAQWNTTHKSNLLSEPSIQLEDVSHSPCPIPRPGDTNGASVSVFYGCAHWGRARIVAYFTARPWNWVVLHSLNKSLDGRLRVMKTWWVRAIVVAAWTCLWIIYILLQIG